MEDKLEKLTKLLAEIRETRRDWFDEKLKENVELEDFEESLKEFTNGHSAIHTKSIELNGDEDNSGIVSGLLMAHCMMNQALDGGLVKFLEELEKVNENLKTEVETLMSSMETDCESALEEAQEELREEHDARVKAEQKLNLIMSKELGCQPKEYAQLQEIIQTTTQDFEDFREAVIATLTTLNQVLGEALNTALRDEIKNLITRAKRLENKFEIEMAELDLNDFEVEED